ncbi:glycoside hydrolase family 65 protein [Methylobacterium radiodurans]|uniref:Family 65 glycosyl hydrolase n=1 Tax=Methylobacterium radiodurans TaxID=2202828 RepID=A0A2U8VSB0_9HYPH|nr:glycosyl hydrolase family 65 protein [Methylobacterium radiodurans]AWN36341.1 family 65 glycosyl hydrolase [Methylobacterium radiodurans]
MLRPRLIPPDDVFPPNPWAIEAVRFDARLAHDLTGQAETMFALSNGHLGLRGIADEGRPVAEPGTYLNGFYEHRPIVYGERAYGFPSRGQSILNCPDGIAMGLTVDGEPFALPEAEILSYRRVLDFRTGTLDRDVRWVTAAGKSLRLRTCRLVSLAQRDLAAIEYVLTVEAGEAEVAITSELRNDQPLATDTSDPRLAEGFVGRVLHPAGTRSEALRAILSYRTRSSELVLGCGMDHAVAAECPLTTRVSCTDDLAALVFRGVLPPGGSIRIHKFLSYHYCATASPEQIRAQVGRGLDGAIQSGFPAILARQRQDVDRFWERADVTVEAPTPRTQQALRWNLFQLMQATERAEGHGIPARGLTGRTYEGHYFWDTEIYILPFLVYTNPLMARSLLKVRYAMLDKARARARELGHRGATFPWRTINGEEASAYYAAGTAQYHINADIAYALRKYVEISGDLEFLHDYGAEMLVETARLWCDLGFFSERMDGRFCINGVTGPDEYTALVNNNCFTNLMARDNLRYAARTVRALEHDNPEGYVSLLRRTGLDPAEPDAWETAADRMYLPYDERMRIHPQDDSFLDLETWDFAATPEENYPLLLHYHPLNLYRAQVIKQADVVLAMFLLSDQFSPEAKQRNFAYYDPLTTHDSSLSVCIQSIVANEIGLAEKALHYFDFALAMDLSDIGGNMMHGVHIAAIGGTWLALVYGFAGLRDAGGRLTFDPCLPESWARLRFTLAVRGRRIGVDIDRATATYRLIAGEELIVWHGDACVRLTPQEPVVAKALRRPPRAESE